MIRGAIEAALKTCLIELGAPDAGFVVERPRVEHGDYATNAALAAGKFLKQNPREVADAIVKHLLAQKIDGVEKVEVAGAGFINFYLSRQVLLYTVEQAARDKAWGKNNLYENKVVMVEYTDPNPFKEFHIGHLMSNAIGESIARVLECAGAEVLRANYQGDVGPHVAKAIFVLLEQQVEEPTIAQISAAYVEGAKRYEESAADKAAIDEINKKIYDQSDEKVNTIYAQGRKVSLEHFEALYKTLGTKFDYYFFESETAPLGKKIVEAHPELFVESEGALVFKGEQYGLHTRVFVTSKNLPTYEAKELGLAELKQKKSAFDLSITITASEQNGFMEVVFKALSLLMPDLKERLVHRSHGMMRIASGKMSSRKGNVITGEALLLELTEAARGKSEVAVGAIKYVVLRQGSGKDIVFDPDKSLSIEGDSGPYLQYSLVRAKSLVKKAHEAAIKADTRDAPESPNELERVLVHYPEALARAARELEPHYVTTYLTELASAFNSWYASERVVGGPNPHYGLLLAEAVKKTLTQGLYALGIPAPEEM